MVEPDRVLPINLGRYILLERLAAGGMSEIYRAKTEGAHGFEKTLVVKRLAGHLAGDPHFVDMFISEAKVMVQLNHPKIVQVIDFGEIDGHFFMAMEYVDGLDLLAVLRRCALRNCRPSVEIAVHIIAEVLDALDYAHNARGSDGESLHIVHRDISPSNIFISKMGEVKLGDFGIATAAHQESTLEPGVLRGKFGYLAPEYVTSGTIDHRADLFSVGVVLAELLTIRRLFVGNSDLEVLLQVRDAKLDRLHENIDRVPPELRPVLASALSRDSATRYQDAAGFRDALHWFLLESRRMVHRTDVRRFLEHLVAGRVTAERFVQPEVSAPPTMPAPKTEESELADDLTPVVTMFDVGKHDMQRIPSVVGNRRKVVLGPPPKPDPVPEDARRTRDTPSLATDELLAVVSEKKPPTNSFQDAVGWVPPLEQQSMEQQSAIPTPTPPPVERLGAANESQRMQEVVESRLLTRSEWATMARPTQSGLLQERSLFAVMFALAIEEETGLLVLRSRDSVKEIYIVDGDPQYVISDRMEELFGQYLVEKEIISEGELAMALAVLPQFRGKLGDALVQLKLVTAVQATRHLTKQVRQKIVDAFYWREGGFAYYRGQRCEHESAPLGLDAFEVLGAAALALDENQLDERLRPYLSQHPRATPDPIVPPEVFRLGPRPRSVFEQCAGQHTLAELLSRFDVKAERDTFGRIAYLLLESGLVKI